MAGPVPAEEHRAVNLEVIVVAPIEGVEVDASLALQELAVRFDRGVIGLHHRPVVAAQHVDVRGHVPQVAGVRHQVAQQVACGEGALGMRRHLHQVDVHVQQAGVGRFAPGFAPFHGPFKDLDRFRRVRALRDGTGLQIPQSPRRAIHDRLRKQRRDVRIVPVFLVDRAHRRRVVVIPGTHVGGGFRRRISAAKRTDQGLLRLRRGNRQLLGPDDGIERGRERAAGIVVVEGFPGLVVVRTGGICDAPPGHRAFRVRLDRLAIARDRFVVVVAVGPGKPSVEPELGPGGTRRHRPAVRSEVVVVRHAAVLHCRPSARGADVFRLRSMPAGPGHCSRVPPPCPADGCARARGHGCRSPDAGRS